MNKFFYFTFLLLILTSCASPKNYLRSKIEKPIKVILEVNGIGVDWTEEFRIAFERYGYEVILKDEVKTVTQTVNEGGVATTRENLIDEKGIRYIFKLLYTTKWDIIDYVSNYSIRITDGRTLKTVGSRTDSFVMRHPSPEQVVDEIENDFLNKLYIQEK